jgi:FixJ family two-component response regulator
MLLDVSMPEMGGDELLPILESKYPRLKVILSSGYGEENVSRSVHSPSVMGFLHKPYAGDALTAMIEKALS